MDRKPGTQPGLSRPRFRTIPECPKSVPRSVPRSEPKIQYPGSRHRQLANILSPHTSRRGSGQHAKLPFPLFNRRSGVAGVAPRLQSPVDPAATLVTASEWWIAFQSIRKMATLLQTAVSPAGASDVSHTRTGRKSHAQSGSPRVHREKPGLGNRRTVDVEPRGDRAGPDARSDAPL